MLNSFQHPLCRQRGGRPGRPVGRQVGPWNKFRVTNWVRWV